jgi:hypothetical protein
MFMPQQNADQVSVVDWDATLPQDAHPPHEAEAARIVPLA